MKKELQQQIASLYQAEKTIEEIAEITGYSITSVFNALKNEHVVRRPRGHTGHQKLSREEMEELVVERHLNDVKIGKMLHIHKSIVQRWRDDYGIPPAFSLTNWRGPRQKK